MAGAVEGAADFVDLVARRSGQVRYIEAKGRTAAKGLDVDTLYGQLLRRMPGVDDPAARWVVVVPLEMASVALRVPARIRELLRIDVYGVDELGHVLIRPRSSP